MKKSFVQQSILRKKAKQLKKEKSLSWLKARDEAAIFYGFTNYKNYQNMAEVNCEKRENPKKDLFNTLFIEKQKKISKKLDYLISTINGFQLPFQELLGALKKSEHSKEVMRSLCEKSALKEYVELHLLKSSLEDEGEEMELSYLITKEVSLKNLRYKLGEDILYVRGEYDLKFEFAFEGKDETDDFSDRGSSGSFELTIDKNKNITIEDSNVSFLL